MKTIHNPKWNFWGCDRAEVGLFAKHDGQIDLPEWVCLRSRDHPVEGRTRMAEFRPGDAHGVEGVDVEDVEAAAFVPSAPW